MGAVRTLAICALALASASACASSGASDLGPTATLANASPPTAPALDPEPARSGPPSALEAAAVASVPAEIDADYVQAVMDALDDSFGGFFRQYQAEGGPTLDNRAWLASMVEDPAFTTIDESLGIHAADDFVGWLESSGEPVTRVQRLVASDPDCVVFEGTRNIDAILGFVDGVSGDVPVLMALRPRSGGQSGNTNPTAWVVVLELADTRAGEAPIPCG